MSTDIQCIYCQSYGPFSKEHAIPACLGEFKNFPVLINRVCGCCNHRIGRMEEQFCRCGPEGLFRSALGITGRSSHIRVNPFGRGSAGGKAINLVAPLPESISEPPSERIPVLWEFNPGGGTLREVRQIVLRDEQGRWHQIRIPDWMREPELLRQAINELDIESIEEARYFADPEDMPWVESLVRGLGGLCDPGHIPEPSITQNPVAHFQVTDFYFRAIAKCGFHYLLAVVHEIHGSEPSFAPLRNFIINGGDWEQVFSQEQTTLIAYPEPGYRLNRWAHVIVVEWENGTVQVRTQFFVGPNYEPPVYKIRIANNVDNLIDVGWKGHLFAYFPGGKRGRYYGEVINLIQRYTLIDSNNPARTVYLPGSPSA